MAGVEILRTAELGDLSIQSNILVGDLACLPCNIDIKALACACSNIFCGAVSSPWEESLVIESVQAHVHYRVALVEDVLSAISVMNIPVKDEHFFALVCCILSSNSDIVYVAKARNHIAMSMMAWRSSYAIASLERVIEHFAHSGEAGLAREFGRFVSLSTLIVVPLQVVSSLSFSDLLTRFSNHYDVALRMHLKDYLLPVRIFNLKLGHRLE